MKDSKIEWTHHTFNPWWGCQRVSPGCEHCYAETFSRRLGKDLWGPKAERQPSSHSYWNQPLRWNAAAGALGERHRVFCASMSDVFEDRRDLDEHRARLWALIQATPHLDWLLLTKRPENLVKMLPWACGDAEYHRRFVYCSRCTAPWPNAWVGATAEDQKRYDERIPDLLSVSAVVHFLSCEPLLEPIEFGGYFPEVKLKRGQSIEDYKDCRSGIEWVIVGGESGNGARVFELEWARSIVRQCRASHVPVLVKQLGAAASDPKNGIAGASLKVPTDAAGLVSLRLKDKKGGDWNEWPLDLRVREYPTILPSPDEQE